MLKLATKFAPTPCALRAARFDGLVVSEVNAEHQNARELRMDVLLYELWEARRSTCQLVLTSTKVRVIVPPFARQTK